MSSKKKANLRVVPYTSDGAARFITKNGEVYVTCSQNKVMTRERALWLLEEAKQTLLSGDW